MGSLGQFLALKKYQLALNLQRFLIAFHADDEGSIPFTRSNTFCYLFIMSYCKSWRRQMKPEIGLIQQWYNIIGHGWTWSAFWAGPTSVISRVLSSAPWPNSAIADACKR